MVAIIDDREDVWNYMPNLIHVKPYLFFEGTADINAPPGLKKSGDTGHKRHSKIVKVPKAKDSQKKSNGKKSLSDTKASDRGNSDKDCEKKDTSENSSEQKSAEPLDSDQAMQQEVAEGNRGKCKKDCEEKMYDGNDEKKTNGKDEALDEKETTEHDVEENKSDKTDGKKEADEESETEYEEMIEWEDDDDYLIYLEEILSRIHTAFYEMYDQMKTTANGEFPNVKKIIPYIRKKVLKGTNIVFSGVFPTNSPPEKSKAYKTAQALGANIQTQFEGSSSEFPTTHVVAAKLGTVKVNAALKEPGVQIVTPGWLWSCSNRWERVDERLFKLTAGNSAAHVRDSPDVKRMTSSRKNKRKVSNITQENQMKRHKPDEESTKNDEATDNNEAEDEEMDESMDVDNEEPSTSKPKPRMERQFSETLNPLISFSAADIENMDKEVEDILDESDSEDSDEKEELNLRKKVLGQSDDNSSSEESLSGDLPRGWNLKKKHPHKKLPSEDDEEETDGIGIAGEEEDPHKVFSPSSESDSNLNSDDSDFNESVGSVDEEMAEALEREFLNS